jgi:dihydroorotate dehydrogenase electron transfer subunit
VFTAFVVLNEKLCDEHYLLTLRLAEFPPTQAGQFVQLQCRPPAAQPGSHLAPWEDCDSGAKRPKFTQPELTSREPILRRPFSLAGDRRDSGGVELDIIYRVVGAGTGWLAGVVAGRELSLIGPLGNALPVQPSKPLAVLIGGGVGIPPMIYFAEALGRAGKTAIAFNGVKSRNLLPLSLTQDAPPYAQPSLCCEEFNASDAAAVVATDDGTVGYHGLVTDAFSRWLDESGTEADELAAYSCGPEPMMQAVGEICIARGIECHLSLERHMACGMGTCQSCIVKIRDDSPQGWSYKLCCTDGPVFDARDIVWE